MPAPTNISAATATDLGTFPVTVTQDVSGAAGPNFEVWYSVTPPSGTPDALGIWAFGTIASAYHPALSIFIGPASSPVAYPSGSPIQNVDRLPVQYPVTASTTYYLRIRQANSGVTPDVVLTLSGALPNNLSVPAGAIAVNDDTSGFPLALLSASDGTVTRFIGNIAAGEGGDTLPNGIVALEDVDLSGVRVYSSAMTPIGSAVTTRVRPIRTNVSGTKFYSAYRGTLGADAVIGTITSTGTLGGTTWTLTGNTNVVGIGASPDETILYFVRGASAAPVQRWDLVNDVALSNLAAGTANVTPGGTNDALLVLADGSIVVAFHNTSTGANFVKVYAPAGTLLQTVSFSTNLIDRLATSPIASHFWVWTQPDSITDVFTEINASTGATVGSVASPEFEDGVYAGAISATPPRFGHSNSCPFWIVRQPIGVPTTTTTYPVRRLRQTAHLSSEQLWLFFSKFQLDCETGVGLNDGQGSDPQVMLSWSDDGGHTWSPERWMSAGKIGEYKRRVIWRVLGRSRDRVWRIVVSDPVAWRLLTAYIDVAKGTS